MFLLLHVALHTLFSCRIAKVVLECVGCDTRSGLHKLSRALLEIKDTNSSQREQGYFFSVVVWLFLLRWPTGIFHVIVVMLVAVLPPHVYFSAAKSEHIGALKGRCRIAFQMKINA